MNTQAISRRRARLGLAPATLAVAAALSAWSDPSQAFRFGSEEGLSGSFDSVVSLGAIRRMSSPDSRIIGNDSGGGNRGSNTQLQARQGSNGYANADFNYTNFDDGTLNYKKGDIVSMALKGTHDLSLKAPDGWSALARFYWLHDFKADQTRRTEVTESSATSRANLLDAWVAKEIRYGDQRGKVKLGNQVISWGEDIFILGGVNQINAIDLQKFHVPGTQIKEVFIPAPMASWSGSLTEHLGMEAYYQFAWNSFKFDPAGTFFSGADVIGQGNRVAYYPTSICNDFALPTPCGDRSGLTDRQMLLNGTAVPYLGQAKPKQGGQYGVNFRYNAESIDTEFAFTYQRYHDKLPFLGFTGSNTGAVTGYFLAYGEDRDLFAISGNTKVGDVAVGMELSFRPRDSVGVDPTVPFGSIFGGSYNKNSVYDVGRHPGFVEYKKWQYHATAFYTFSRNDPLGGLATALGATDGFILAEAAVAHYPDLDRSGNIPYFLPNYGIPNRTSWGYVAEIGINYPNVAGSGITLTPQIDFAHDVKGTAPNALPFVEGRKAVTLSVFANYRDRWKGALQYANFSGGGDNNLMRDRDFLAASVSYSF